VTSWRAGPGRTGGAFAVRPLPVHALLFAAFPPLFLYASNLDQRIAPGDVLLHVGVIVGVATALTLVAGALFGDARRGGLVVTAWIALFFTYGHVWALVPRTGGPVTEVALLAAWAALALGAVVVAATAGRWLAAATRGLNVAAAVLVVLNVGLIAVGVFGTPNAPTTAPGGTANLRPKGFPPDIYYIVMDRYGAAETLRKRFGFDNTPFLRSLGERGFAVPPDSLANYPKTAHSLAASLNMGYLDHLADAVGPGSDDWNPVYDLLSGPRVTRSLQAAGYTYVHIGSRWDPTRVDQSADVNAVSSGMSEFAQVLYEPTLLGPLARHAGVLAESLDPRTRERRRTMFQFEQLAEARKMAGPTFVFAHILLPHEPYLFEADGGMVTEREEAARSFEQNFVGQIRFANRRLLEVIDVLLSGRPEERPVIVLQADEGPHPRGYLADEVQYDWTAASDRALSEKLRILNAYHLPGITDRPAGPGRRGTRPYDTISPVNTFRMVFDAYFDARLPLLPDRSYVFVNEEHLYDFVEVTGRVRRS
jgi:hypothetical protein